MGASILFGMGGDDGQGGGEDGAGDGGGGGGGLGKLGWAGKTLREMQKQVRGGNTCTLRIVDVHSGRSLTSGRPL